jgi:uroporphyrin-3 C-methyltransferase
MFVVFLLVLVLFAGVGSAAWWLYPQWQSRADELADLNAQLERERAALVALEQRLAQVDTRSAKVRKDIGASQQQQSKQLKAMTERLNAHNQRLLSLSNTSREDWQLAEAHYLLRLASQRLLVDRSATSALGLMEATDAILRDLNMPDLFPVREALAQDLGAVRLAAEIDREGVFLRLQGLIDNIDRLPLFATPELPEPEPVEAFVAAPEDDLWAKTWGWTKHAGRSVLVELRKYFAVRQHDQVEPPMLPPTASEYLRQNVRFNLEQAQVALLREQQIVYRESLAQTGQLLDRYFPDSSSAQALQKELVHLSNQDIQSQLPSISGSLAQLQAYIERLHRLAPKEVSEPES